MTTTELIAQLQQLQAEHGVLAVYLEAAATGINLMDEGGNVFERYTISPLAEKCEVSRMEDGTTKVVWVMGSVAANETGPDGEDQDTPLDSMDKPGANALPKIVCKGEITMTIKKKDTSEQYDAGWRDAIEAFSKQWEAKPDNIGREELIRSTNRLLILLHPDTENLTEEEISKRI